MCPFIFFVHVDISWSASHGIYDDGGDDNDGDDDDDDDDQDDDYDADPDGEMMVNVSYV